MQSLAYIKEQLRAYIDNRLCNISQAFKAYVDTAIEGVEAGSGSDISEPAMTRTELEAATGIPAGTNSIYLTDGVSPNLYAWRNISDTTSPSSSTIIVDGDGVRWWIMSMREFNNRLLNNFSPFP